MLMTATVGVVAALVLGAGLVGPGLMADEEVSPAGAEPSLVASDWAFFEGTFEGEPERISPESFLLDEEGLQVHLRAGWAGGSLVATDARLSGEWIQLGNEFRDPMTNEAIWTNTVTITNDAGAWICQITGVQGPGRNSGALGGGWCDGTGGFDGLRAFLGYTHYTGDESGSDILGYVSSGDGPPPAELPLE